MNIILFGPPGIGKSTLIGALKSQGVRAIDLEDVYPSSIRFQLPSMVDGVVFGAADLSPKRSYNNAIKVLLTMEQSEYDLRRRMRDEKFPEKKAQPFHSMDKWMDADYDAYLFANLSISQLVSQIAQMLKEENGESKQFNRSRKKSRGGESKSALVSAESN